VKKRLYSVIAVGGVTFSIFCWLVALDFLPMFPTLLILPPVLFVAIWLVVRMTAQQSRPVPTEAFGLSKMVWVLIVVFAINFVVQVLNLIRLRNMYSVVQVFGGLLVPAVLWILVYRVGCYNKRQSSQKLEGR